MFLLTFDNIFLHVDFEDLVELDILLRIRREGLNLRFRRSLFNFQPSVVFVFVAKHRSAFFLRFVLLL